MAYCRKTHWWVSWGGAFGDCLGGATHVNRWTLSMVLCFVALCGGGLRKGTVAAVWPLEFCLGQSCPHHPPWCQTLQFLPIRHWCPSSCCPSAGAQKEWVCVSPKSGPFTRSCLRIPVFSAISTPTGFHSQNFWGLIFLALEPCVGWPGVGLGSPTPEVSLLIFIHYTQVWGCPCNMSMSLCLHCSYPFGWMRFL